MQGVSTRAQVEGLDVMPRAVRSGAVTMTDDLRALLLTQHAAHLELKKAAQLCPYVFVRMVAAGRGGAKQPKRIRAFTKAWKGRVPCCRRPWPHSSRSATHGRAQHGPPRCARARRDEAHRPQDSERASALQHRERWRS
jgi:hypothetical protein